MAEEFIPLIHSIRQKVQSRMERERELGHPLPLPTQEEEVSHILSELVLADSWCEGFEDMETVKYVRALICEHLERVDNSMASPSPHTSQLATSQGEGELARLAAEVSKSVLADADRPRSPTTLLSTARTVTSSSRKRQKHGSGGGGYISFNFDDMPMYEPLEVTLRVLRADIHSKEGWMKVLAMEPEDLIDNPQWEEMILLMRRSLSCEGGGRGGGGGGGGGAVHSSVLPLCVHIRLLSSLPPTQSLDVCLCILDSLHEVWMPASPLSHIGSLASSLPDTEASDREMALVRGDGHGSSGDSGDTEFVEHFYPRDALTLTRLAALSSVIKCVSGLFCTENKRVDQVVVSVMLLLSSGYAPVQCRCCVTASDGSELCENRVQSVSVMEVLMVSSADNSLFEFIREWTKKGLTVSVVCHAVHSGLVSRLWQGLRECEVTTAPRGLNWAGMCDNMLILKRISLYCSCLLQLVSCCRHPSTQLAVLSASQTSSVSAVPSSTEMDRQYKFLPATRPAASLNKKSSFAVNTTAAVPFQFDVSLTAETIQLLGDLQMRSLRLLTAGLNSCRSGSDVDSTQFFHGCCIALIAFQSVVVSVGLDGVDGQQSDASTLSIFRLCLETANLLGHLREEAQILVIEAMGRILIESDRHSELFALWTSSLMTVFSSLQSVDVSRELNGGSFQVSPTLTKLLVCCCAVCASCPSSSQWSVLAPLFWWCLSTLQSICSDSPTEGADCGHLVILSSLNPFAVSLSSLCASLAVTMLGDSLWAESVSSSHVINRHQMFDILALLLCQHSLPSFGSDGLGCRAADLDVDRVAVVRAMLNLVQAVSDVSLLQGSALAVLHRAMQAESVASFSWYDLSDGSSDDCPAHCYVQFLTGLSLIGRYKDVLKLMLGAWATNTLLSDVLKPGENWRDESNFHSLLARLFICKFRCLWSSSSSWSAVVRVLNAIIVSAELRHRLAVSITIESAVSSSVSSGGDEESDEISWGEDETTELFIRWKAAIDPFLRAVISPSIAPAAATTTTTATTSVQVACGGDYSSFSCDFTAWMNSFNSAGEWTNTQDRLLSQWMSTNRICGQDFVEDSLFRQRVEDVVVLSIQNVFDMDLDGLDVCAGRGSSGRVLSAIGSALLADSNDNLIIDSRVSSLWQTLRSSSPSSVGLSSDRLLAERVCQVVSQLDRTLTRVFSDFGSSVFDVTLWLCRSWFVDVLSSLDLTIASLAVLSSPEHATRQAVLVLGVLVMAVGREMRSENQSSGQGGVDVGRDIEGISKAIAAARHCLSRPTPQDCRNATSLSLIVGDSMSCDD